MEVSFCFEWEIVVFLVKESVNIFVFDDEGNGLVLYVLCFFIDDLDRKKEFVLFFMELGVDEFVCD